MDSSTARSWLVVLRERCVNLHRGSVLRTLLFVAHPDDLSHVCPTFHEYCFNILISSHSLHASQAREKFWSEQAQFYLEEEPEEEPATAATAAATAVPTAPAPVPVPASPESLTRISLS
jgi:hypothetical protein